MAARIEIIGTTNKRNSCHRCPRDDLQRVVVVRGYDAQGNDVSGDYGSGCVWRVMGYPARPRKAELDHEIAAAQAKADTQRYMYARWSNYLTSAGAALFRQRNPRYAHRSDREIFAEAIEVVTIAAAVLGPLGEDLAALVGTE
jgi:hypothetical protein